MFPVFERPPGHAPSLCCPVHGLLDLQVENLPALLEVSSVSRGWKLHQRTTAFLLRLNDFLDGIGDGLCLPDNRLLKVLS